MTTTTTTTTAPVVVHIVSDDRAPRSRTRLVSLPDVIRRAALRAASGKTSYAADHGGDVNNSYGYPARTQAVFAGARRVDGAIHVLVWAGELPANKVTLSGVAGMAGYRPLADERYGDESRAAAFAALRQEIEAVAAADPTGDYIAGYVATHGGESAFAATAEAAIDACCETYEAALAR